MYFPKLRKSTHYNLINLSLNIMNNRIVICSSSSVYLLVFSSPSSWLRSSPGSNSFSRKRRARRWHSPHPMSPGRPRSSGRTEPGRPAVSRRPRCRRLFPPRHPHRSTEEKTTFRTVVKNENKYLLSAILLTETFPRMNFGVLFSAKPLSTSSR
jgi:hypothetical protein